jgi:hypothetical protein
MSSQFSVLSSTVFLFALFSQRALSQCDSFGIDIGSGTTNYINLLSGAEFSYQGGFAGQFVETLYVWLNN